MGAVNAVAVVLHPERDCGYAIGAVSDWARAHGATVLGRADELARAGEHAEAVTAEDLTLRADLIISLGGDGTMLRAMRLAVGGRAPVLGVNLGRLGFLAEIDVPDLPQALSAIDEHRFTAEPRSAVSAVIDGRETVAFNDIVLIRRPGDPSAAVALRVDGQPFVRYAADAVIAATPTGSTAYSFSAGGPLVSPGAEGMLVVPVAPHSAFNRALFLSAGEKLSLELLPQSGELGVEADGRLMGSVRPGDVVEVVMVPAAAKVIRLGGTTFYQRAQRKLRLSGSAEAETVVSPPTAVSPPHAG
ncbi:NAD+ kinase [Kitasatospora sp. MAA4]|uniref:NAD(+)/NADH kinase n=1 Tax=Kitasatospora sp. MAA4 TaxID=3035093 RepID=UPI002475C7D3|nr:NAD(+)/NADH kinase [Kitasatospora sp. MAA4]MDH6136860.1 NAD+ kinase [Kitasatospora sp. MAA4]